MFVCTILHLVSFVMSHLVPSTWPHTDLWCSSVNVVLLFRHVDVASLFRSDSSREPVAAQQLHGCRAWLPVCAVRTLSSVTCSSMDKNSMVGKRTAAAQLLAAAGRMLQQAVSGQQQIKGGGLPQWCRSSHVA